MYSNVERLLYMTQLKVYGNDQAVVYVIDEDTASI